MKHVKRLGKAQLPGRGTTLLEWEQKGIILGTFADAFATLNDILKSAQN